MPTGPQKPAPPSKGKRWKIVDATMRRHGHSPDALIETLHTVQESIISSFWVRMDRCWMS